MAAAETVSCPACHAQYRVSPRLLGRTLRCKKCRQPVPVPAAETPPPEPPPKPVVVARPMPDVPVVAPTPPDEDVFAALGEPNPGRIQARLPRRPGRHPLGWMVLALVLAAVIVAAGLFGGPLLNPQAAPLEPTQVGPNAPARNDLIAAVQVYPRRLLVVNVTKYLYCNPLSSGNRAKQDLVSEAARRLAFQWRVPTGAGNDQLFVVSDVGDQRRSVSKPVLRAAISGFTTTSRAQDRILLYFGGHATHADGQAWLVPADGDLADTQTLVPVAEVFAALAASPTLEKIVVFDVCRVTPGGDRQRPGSEPMTTQLEQALLQAPPDVQVIVTCQAGTNALEFRAAPAGHPEVGGSLFLSALTHLAVTGSVSQAADPTPADPLPIETWVTAAQTRMNTIATAARAPAPTLRSTRPTPRPEVLPDPAESPAARIELPEPPVGLPVVEVARLTAPVSALPPFRGQPSPDDAVDTLVSYPVEVMNQYSPGAVTNTELLRDAADFPVRAATLTALASIKKTWRSSGTDDNGLRTEIYGPSSESLKREVLAEQIVPARIEDDLDMILLDLEKLRPLADEEPSKYWQVTYLYTLAQVKARLAFMREYNLALGLIRTDNLPDVSEKDAAGFVLISTDRMRSRKDVKDLADDATELFEKIARDHPNTPWAVLAKRHQVMALGLEWKPQITARE